MWNEVFSYIDNKNINFVSVSNYLITEVMEDYKINISNYRYSIIHNYIDTGLFKYRKKTANHRLKILSIRSFSSAMYANDLMVEAILILSKEIFFKDLEFRIIGEGILFNTIIEPVLTFQNVIVEKRFVLREEISDIHENHGIFLSPTRMDTQGVSRDEAMSSGACTYY